MVVAKRRITADTKSKISNLVDVLHNFLPLSARSKNTVTFTSIFKESNISKYLDGYEVKRKALQNGWENVFRYHPRLPFSLINKIVPAAIEYRRAKRNPLKKEELEKLISVLLDIGINMKPVLSKIEIDESVPEITVPPEELVKRLENHPLVEQISSNPLQLFKDGHFNEAVRKAAERFEKEIQDRTGLSDSGKQLMGKAFSGTSPRIPLNSLNTENEKNIQEGYQLITMGVMMAIRNIFSHGDENKRKPEEAYEMLLLLNWLFSLLP